MPHAASVANLELKIESLEAEIQRLEVNYPKYARVLRTKLLRYRFNLEALKERIRAQAEAEATPTESDNFADGGRRKRGRA